MSYYTTHQVSWDRQELPEEEVARDLAETEKEGAGVRIHGAQPGRNRAGDWLEILTGAERAEWPDVSGQMRQVSERHPGVTFTVEGRGEEMRDTWREYFLDGRSQLVQMPDFDTELAV